MKTISSRLSGGEHPIHTLFPFQRWLLVAFALVLAQSVAYAQNAAPPSSGNASPDYVIGPGDNLNVFVWRNDDLSTSVAVRPDGKITIPLVDDMQAVGKTPSRLARDIENVLGEFIRTPQVSVMVNAFGIGAYDNQIRIVGSGVVRPQSIPFRNGLTVLDVMIEVGLSEFAAGDRAKLVRRADGEPTEIGVKLNRLINRGDLRQNLALQPGDVLMIPATRF
jgi:polysaccharide biosynthesis/export protein